MSAGRRLALALALLGLGLALVAALSLFVGSAALSPGGPAGNRWSRW